MAKIIIVFLITSILFSCKKDKAATINKTRSQLLTQGSWHTTSKLTRSNPADPWVNSTGGDPCSADNITIFNSANTYIIDGGALLCTGQGQTAEEGLWAFINNETHLLFTRNLPNYMQEQDWTILQLDENTLKFEFYYPTGPYYQITMEH